MTAFRGFIVVMSLAAMMARPSVAAAQSDPFLAIGQKVTLTTADGKKIQGQVLSLSPTTVDIGKDGKVTTSLALADVRRVQVPDSVTNGVIKGAFTLGVIGLLAGGVADAGNAVGQAFGGGLVLLLGGEPQPVHQSHNYVTGAVVGVAFGALLGYAIDADKEKTLYERGKAGKSVAVRPIVSAAGKGVGVQVRW